VKQLQKTPTGIAGLDEITKGGLPKGRPTLVCGKAGCGKTLMAMEFIVKGVTEFDEPGVFISFEENEQELALNVASFGWDLNQLIEDEKIALDHIYIEPSEIIETGDFDLDGLLIRIAGAVETVGAKRIAIDTLEVLFGSFNNADLLRGELRRLFRWLKEKNLTAVITGEKSGENLTRQGIEEFVSDCVIYLQHDTEELIATRRLQIVKYRGASHGANLYPFLITDKGLSLLPVTSAGLKYEVSEERIPTGIADLDAMLGDEGFYRGSSVLISGTAGTGKTSFASKIVEQACLRGERAILFSFEESESQIIRNMRSIGIDLQTPLGKGLLRFANSRASSYGLETHLINIFSEIEQFNPGFVVFDPISNIRDVGKNQDVKNVLTRIIDHLKMSNITSIMTNLSQSSSLEATEAEISSLMDTWILLRDIESGSERNKGVFLLKSRGISHSNQIREYHFSEKGIQFFPVYDGPEGVLTGTARIALEEQEGLAEKRRMKEIERLKKELETRQASYKAKLSATQAEFESETAVLQQEIDIMLEEQERRSQIRARLSSIRGGA
jgi:circadian clock protein KaiC